MTALLSLVGCRFEVEATGPALPVLERSGRIESPYRRVGPDGELALPPLGVRLPVVGDGHQVGLARARSRSDDRGDARGPARRGRARRPARRRARTPRPVKRAAAAALGTRQDSSQRRIRSGVQPESWNDDRAPGAAQPTRSPPWRGSWRSPGRSSSPPRSSRSAARSAPRTSRSSSCSSWSSPRCSAAGSGASVAALVSVASFDFFFTRPYYSFSINARDDVETAVLLLVVGLVVGELVVRTRRSRDPGRGEPRRGGARPPALRARRRRRARRPADRDRAGRARRRSSACATARFEPLPFRDDLPELTHQGVRHPRHRDTRGRRRPDGLRLAPRVRRRPPGRSLRRSSSSTGATGHRAARPRTARWPSRSPISSGPCSPTRSSTDPGAGMADIVFIVVVIGFFALCAALVVGCDRIVRSGDDGSQSVDRRSDGGAAVSAREPRRAHPRGGAARLPRRRVHRPGEVLMNGAGWAQFLAAGRSPRRSRSRSSVAISPRCSAAGRHRATACSSRSSD